MTNRHRNLKSGLALLPVVSLTIPLLQTTPAHSANCDPTTDAVNTVALGSTFSGAVGQDVCNLAPGSITTTGVGAAGIFADGGNATNSGSITTAGDLANGVHAKGGDATNSGSVITTGAFAFGAFADGGNVINTGSISTTSGLATGANAMNGDVINAGSITTAANATYGAYASNGDIINSGSISTTGDGAYGTLADNGNVTNSGSITTTGFFAFGAFAISADVTNTGSIATTGNKSYGVFANGGNVTNTGSIITAGDNAFGAYAEGGDLTNTGSIITSGIGAYGIYTGFSANTVYNSGTVTSTNASAIYLDAGNDTLILAGNATVNGLMDGGADTDTLDFSLNVDEKYYDQVVAELQALIDSGSPNGTITIQGHTYDWVSFENLVNSLHSEITSFHDGRINPWDFQQTMTGWCVDSGEHGYAFYNINANSQGDPIFNVTNAQVNAALEKAAASDKPVLLGEKNGKSVWALPSHELQMHDGTPGGTYNYIWAPKLCGSYQQ